MAVNLAKSKATHVRPDKYSGEKSYSNIHSTLFPGGEIRGFLQAVPEPGSLALFGLGLVGLALSRRSRRAPFH